LQRVHEIMPQGWVDGVWILLGLELCFIDSDQFLSLAGLFAETVIGDAIKPGGKLRFTPKAANVFVGPQESFLSKIVRQGEVAARKLPQQAAYRGLMIAHELGKGVVIIFKKNPRDKVGIIERHVRSLHLGGRVFFVHIQSPDQQIACPDEERDDA
jgi:hypothetical protein